jgi:3-hydroxyisobutyrate dehydrogenase-like beta-hydroxyacid dehydrogenase
MDMDITSIGLGSMGSAMARNLAAAGHRVRAWNRSGCSVEGVIVLDAVGDAFDADVILTMLFDDTAIRSEILDADLLSTARSGAIHVVSSTISVAFAEELVAAHEPAGVGIVSAPVLGRPDVAATGNLNVIVGGAPAAIERVRPVLEAIGSRVWPMGERAPAANVAKIACNMMIAMAIEAMAEAVVLAETNGLSRDNFFELILGTLFGGRPYQTYSANIASGRYDAGFKASLGLKDLRLAKEAAGATGRVLPMLDAAHVRMGEAIAAGISPTFRVNGTQAPDSEEYAALRESGFANWKLKIGGLVNRPLEFSLIDLKRLPSRTQITRHDCVEGWSAIGKWTGVPLGLILQTAGLKLNARFAVFHCADELERTLDGSGRYYESIDLFDAFHPQTILAYAMNDADLPVGHGAPLRLRVERQLGYKQAKYVMRIEIVDSLDGLWGGNGGFWEDRGYQWYAGI